MTNADRKAAVRNRSKGRASPRRFGTLKATACASLAITFFAVAALLAQESPSLVINEDCKAFAIAPDNTVAFAVPRMKSFGKIVIERDEIWVASPGRNKRMIVDPDKFMPVPPPTTYSVESMSWSPDSQKLAVSMQTREYPWTPKVKGKKKGSLDDDYEDDNTKEARQAPGPAPTGGGKVVALFDENGHEIKVANLKSRFIEASSQAAWLADGKTLVYLTGSQQIARVSPDDGKTDTLFDGKRFNAVAWDPLRNRAFAVGEGLSINSRLALVQLDLLHETVEQIARLDSFSGSLAVSPNGTSVGFFRDGDTIEVRNLASPAKPVTVKAGMGRFEFDRDDRRVLLKRGPDDKSNDLIWVRLNDGDFTPILHDLIYHDFHISPDGTSLGVTDPGKGILRLYPLE